MTVNNVEILLVEDNPADLELTLHALRQSKLANRIEIARDGEEALDFLFCRGVHSGRNHADVPRVVLLDLKIPKVDGLEVLQQIKQDPRTRNIPVVILTASKEQQDLIAGYRLGVNSYLQKPVDFDAFQKMIVQLGMYWLVVNEPPPQASESNPRSPIE
jgi:two-component system response regulator